MNTIEEVKSEKKNKPCVDCISRTEAINAIHTTMHKFFNTSEDPEPFNDKDNLLLNVNKAITNAIKGLQSDVPDINVGNINCILDKSGKHANKWIPVSEKLPNDRDWYLGIFKEPDTGWINPLPFVCDYVGHETKATTKDHWILRGFTDRGEHIDYYFNLECVAWMQLPKPYKAESGDK